MTVEQDKKYTVRNGADEVLLSTNDIRRARRLLRRLSGPVYIQYEERALKEFLEKGPPQDS